MKMIQFTDFRKNASRYLDEVELGETLVLLRPGSPVAEIAPYTEKTERIPSWKRPGIRLDIPGAELTKAILEERESVL